MRHHEDFVYVVLSWLIAVLVFIISAGLGFDLPIVIANVIAFGIAFCITEHVDKQVKRR